MVEQTDVEFRVESDVTLRGWLFIPDTQGPRPAITMAHGFAGIREHGLDRFARVFADAGFVVLVHDHRGFGVSEGHPRFDVDPWRQIADWRYAISYLESHPAVDADRIGLWGTSYAGGHALVLGATDRRLKGVVVHVPNISRYEQSLRRVAPDAGGALEAGFIDDDRRQFAGEAPPPSSSSARPRDACGVSLARSGGVYNQPVPAGARWENQVTVRSTRAARMYEPGQWVSRVSPTPLLMIIGLNDTITLADTGLAAYERALQPKKLVTIPGDHFDPYLSRFDQSSGAARDWFLEHLV